MKIFKYIILAIFIIMIIVGFVRYQKGQRIKEYASKATEYGLRGEDEKAIEYYQKVIDEDPKMVGAYLGIGVIYFTQGDDERARYYCNQATVIEPKVKLNKAYEFCNVLLKNN